VKKILLIEDRLERQIKFIEDTGIDLNKYSNIMDNQTSLDKNLLKKYSTIITHRSAFGDSDDNVLDYLKKHCEETKTKLVFFSGGISSTYYSKTKYEFLLLNSKSFYNKNLELFLEDVKASQKENLLLLAYGKKWKINILLNTLSKINLFINNNLNEVIIDLYLFKIETKIDNINNFITIEYPKAIKGGVNLSEIIILANKITKDIQREVELNV